MLFEVVMTQLVVDVNRLKNRCFGESEFEQFRGPVERLGRLRDLEEQVGGRRTEGVRERDGEGLDVDRGEGEEL